MYQRSIKSVTKQDILNILGSFPYDRCQYWLITGGAMVFRGFREETGDIDLGCTTEMADRLETEGYLVRKDGDGKRRFRVGETIEIFEDWLYDSVEMIEGVQVISVNGLLRRKQELGREKDLREIELIRGRSGFRGDSQDQ